jgi:hypothetical protein
MENKGEYIRKFITVLGFLPKENTSGVFQKKYPKADNYAIEIDLEKEIINFGNKINEDSKTTQNFSQAENWVVLECVDRLLEKRLPARKHNVGKNMENRTRNKRTIRYFSN